jgi:hypothetical protein
MSDRGFRSLQRCLDKFMECPAFHEFHDNVTNDCLFFSLFERVVKLDNIRLMSISLRNEKYVIKFLHDADLAFQVLTNIGAMKRSNDFDCNNLICVDFSGFVHSTERPTTSQLRHIGESTLREVLPAKDCSDLPIFVFVVP